jgi:hypothetical protein
MRPYNIKPNDVSSIWIDLDHILAIYDPLILSEEETQRPSLWNTASFSILLAFQNKTLQVYADGSSEEDIDKLRKVHADLVQAWTSNDMSETHRRIAELYALQTHIGTK